MTSQDLAVTLVTLQKTEAPIQLFQRLISNFVKNNQNILLINILTVWSLHIVEELVLVAVFVHNAFEIVIAGPHNVRQPKIGPSSSHGEVALPAAKSAKDKERLESDYLTRRQETVANRITSKQQYINLIKQDPISAALLDNRTPPGADEHEMFY